MPMHDWTTVEDGIFHAFHHEWISELKRALNKELLTSERYAMLQDRELASDPGGGTATMTLPKTKHVAERFGGLRQRRSSRVVVRHISDDRVVAIIEIVSPGNKSSANAMRAFVRKAGELLDQRIHLLLLDPFPPGPRDPSGIHAAIWDDYAGEAFTLPANEPISFVAYESAETVRAYIETLAVGDRLPEMPLFLAPEYYVQLPLESMYQSAWETLPARWRRVIAPGD